MVKIQCYPDIEALSRAAADEFVFRAREACAERGQFLASLAGGGTPQQMFDMLAQLPYREEIPWQNVQIFWGDERCVPPDQAESNYRQVYVSIAQKTLLPSENLHRVKGELPPLQAAEMYRQELEKWAPEGMRWPIFDFVLLGMGEDGHTASLFPGSEPDLVDPVLAVTAAYQGRPANRVTLTPRVINSARSIYVMVAGANKAQTLAHVLQGEKNLVSLPIQRIQPAHGEMTWLVDQNAASLLK
jgi:6-phosphogluconolactonase